jgi:hypothetical protein
MCPAGPPARSWAASAGPQSHSTHDTVIGRSDAASSRPRGRSPRGVQTSQHPRRGHRWPPVAAAAPGSLTKNSCTLIPGRQAPRRCPGRSTHLSPPARKPDAEHVESMWSLPIGGFLRAGLTAAGIIVRVGAPARWAYPPGGGTARRQTRPAPCPRTPLAGGAGRSAAPRRRGERRRKHRRHPRAPPPRRVNPPRRPRVPLHMSERSAIDEWVRAKWWRTALWWVGAPAALALILWMVFYAAQHAMPTGG